MSTVTLSPISQSAPDQATAVMLAQGIIAAYANDQTQLPAGFTQNISTITGMEQGLFGKAYSVNWGFAASNGSVNIVVLRGTEAASTNEVMDDIDSWGVNTDCILTPSTTNYGQVNQSLFQLYTQSAKGVESLTSSVISAVSQFDRSLPLFVSAHSLGGPMATFAALDIDSNAAYTGSITLYTFASLHVGVQSFATAFNGTSIETFRIANLCDFVPSLVGLSADDPSYVHVGLPCTFVWQTWGDWGNHSMANIYQPTVNNHWDVIQTGDLQYPASVVQN